MSWSEAVGREIIHVTLNSRCRRGYWYLQDSFAQIADRMARDLGPGPYFKGEFIDSIQAKIKGLEMIVEQPATRLIERRMYT